MLNSNFAIFAPLRETFPMNETETRKMNELRIDRRTLLVTGGVAVAGLAAAPWLRECDAAAGQRVCRTASEVRRAAGDDDSRRAAGHGREAASVSRQASALKPNMVEPSRKIAHMTTHPAVVVAAAEVFRGWGATVTVGEAPGHVRDTEMALVESGVRDAVDAASVRVRRPQLRSGRLAAEPRPAQQAARLLVPAERRRGRLRRVAAENENAPLDGRHREHEESLRRAAGHRLRLAEERAASARHCRKRSTTSTPRCRRCLAIVDGIDCMEGDGPIMGSLKPMGLIVVGTNLPAVDATVARIMGLPPERIPYLALAANKLGPLDEAQITQRGEAWQEVASPFKIIDAPHLRKMLGKGGPLVT